MFPTFSSHNASTTTLNMSDITAATVGEKTPAATPTARARKMYTASFVSLRVLRNRTAATMAASVNARARLFWTRITVAATLIIMPMTVTANVILVQNSLALSFTLAAIVAAVRFRNTLKDTKDAVYIFLALAVGVAAGVFSPTVAAVMSLMFNIVVLALWELNVGNIYADQRGRMPALPPAEGLLGPRRRSSAALAVGDPDLLAALAPHRSEERRVGKECFVPCR